MMNLRRVTWVALAVLLFTTASAMAQTGSARVRFVHAIPGAANIDILINGQPAVLDLAFGEATEYLQLNAATSAITVNDAETDETLWTQELNLTADTAQTLVASSTEASEFVAYTDDLNPLPIGKTRFTAIHAIEGAPAVDIILADGRPVIPGLEYNQPYGTLDLPTMVYELAVVPAGASLADAILPAEPFALSGGTSYVAVAYGTPESPEIMLLASPSRPEVTGGQVRLVHAVPDVSAVDIYANDVLIVPALGFGESTEYIALPAGSYDVTVQAAGDAESDPLVNAAFEVTENLVLSAFVVPTGAGPALLPNLDDARMLAPQTAVFTLINTAQDTAATASSEFGALFGEVPSGSSESGLLTPTESGITVTVDGETTNLPYSPIYGGVLYTTVLVNGEDGTQVVAVKPASFTQTLASAPGGTAVAANTAPEATEPVQEVVETPVEPTAAPTEVAQVPTEVPAEPTTVPVTPNPETPQVEPPVTEPTAVPTEEVEAVATARVLTNPGVNLQLRQYPSSEALSLGLAPSGATLLVLGREGAPEPPPVQPGAETPTPDPDEEEFIDPVTELEEDEDLDPAETWLHVVYQTPDGGAITAWVNALYVGVQSPEGLAQPLRDLPTVPQNRPGQAVNTAIEPPTPTPIVTSAITTNVSPGANIHIRRLPTVEAESLALLPPGTTTQFIGINEDETWVFVEYTGETGVVRGWIAWDFVTLERLNEPVTLDRLRELLELEIIDEEERGGVLQGAAPTAAVPEDLRDVVVGEVVNLNPGANLHLRRFDTENAESLQLIPVGSTVVIDARNEDATWVRGTFNGVTGWLFAQFIDLTLNGEAFELEELPVVEARPRTPTPSPDPNATPTVAAGG